jgi:nucleoside 2-deoxyribosyltransferase
MRIYVACHNPVLAESMAQKLRERGHTITSRWHDGRPFLTTDQHTLKERQQIAEEDLADVSEADALVLIAGPDKYSGGKFVEAGFALGIGLPVYVSGRRENMLLWHEAVKPFEDLP